MTCSDFFVLHHSQNLLENTTNINVQYVDATAAQAVAIARVFETTAISCHGRSELFVYHSWKEKQKDIKAHAEFSPFPFHAFVSPVFGLICVSFIFHITIQHVLILMNNIFWTNTFTADYNLPYRSIAFLQPSMFIYITFN